MKEITRRKFFSKAGIVLAGAGLAGGLPVLAANLPGFSGPYRIAPLPDRKYSKSFLQRCERSRFSSVEEAVLSIRDEGVEFLVVRDS